MQASHSTAKVNLTSHRLAQIESSAKISVICGKFIEVIIRVKPDFDISHRLELRRKQDGL